MNTRALANAIAWAAILGLIGVAFVMVILLGPFGLILLGLLALFICTSADLREEAPTLGAAAFLAQTADRRSPEHRAARAEEKSHALASFAFCRRCGAVLLIAGIASFAWQQLQY